MEIVVTVRSKTDGAVQEARCPAGGGLTLGRGPDSPVALAGSGISREHLRFEANGNGLAVTDLSSNGTWINGERLPRGEKRALRQTDQVEVPGYVMTVSLPEPVPAVAPAGATAVEAAAPAPALAPPPPSPGGAAALFGRLRSFATSFTGLERFLVFLAVCSLVLLFAYLSL